MNGALAFLGKLARAASLPENERSLLTKAVLLRVPTELALIALPLPAACSLFSIRFGRERGPADAPAAVDAIRDDEQVLLVARAADRALGAFRPRTICLRRSLIVGALLRSRHPILRIGWTRNEQALLIHAWIELDGRRVPDYGPEAVERSWGFRALGRHGTNASGAKPSPEWNDTTSAV